MGLFKKLFSVLALAAALPVFAQQTGTLNVADGAACANASTTAGSSLTYSLSTNSSIALVQLAGTWGATAQFQGSVDNAVYGPVNAVPVDGTAAVTSATSNDRWRVNASGLNFVRVCLSAYASGSVAVTISASNQGSTSSAGSGSGVTSVSGTANQVTASPSTGAVVVGLPSGGVTLPNGSTATTQSPGDNTTKVATDAFVLANGGAVSSVTGTANQISVSPTTGAAVVGFPSTIVVPNGSTASTQTVGDNTTKVATDAFVLANSSLPLSGTTNKITKFTSSTAVGNGSATDDGTDPILSPNGLDVNQSGDYQWTIPNNTSTGTTLNKMVCDDGTGKGIICPAASSTTDNPLGSAANGVGEAPGTTGNTGVCTLGFCQVIFDNTATAGHFAQVSSSVNGDLTDVGTTAPTNGQSYYFVVVGNSGTGTAGTIRQMAPQELSAAQISGGNGRATQIEVNGTVTKNVANYNATTPAAGAGNLNLAFNSSNSGNTTSISAKVPISGNTSTVASANTISGTTLTCGDGSGNVTTSGCPSATGAVTPNTSMLLQSNLTSFSITGAQSSQYITWGPTSGTATLTLPQPGTLSASVFKSTNDNTNTTSPVTTTGTPAAGNLIIVWGSIHNFGGAGPTVSTPTDTCGDTFNVLQATQTVGTSLITGQWYTFTTCSTAQTFTLAYTGGNPRGIVGVAIFQNIQSFDSASQYATSGVPTNPNITTNFSNDLVTYYLEPFQANSCTNTIIPPTGFTTLQSNEAGAGDNVSYAIQTAAGTVGIFGAGASCGSGTLLLQLSAFKTNTTQSFGNGFYFWLNNNGTNPVVITPTSSTITTNLITGLGSGATISINPGQVALIYSDGSNWHAMMQAGQIASTPSVVTVSGNVSTAQNLQSATIKANTLNTANRSLRIWGGGYYSTETANTSTITITCTLGGVTMASWVTAANLGGQSNDTWNVDLVLISTGTGTVGMKAHGKLAIDGITSVASDAVYNDTNHATTSTFNTAADQTLQFTITFSVAGAVNGNIGNQDQLVVQQIN